MMYNLVDYVEFHRAYIYVHDFGCCSGLYCYLSMTAIIAKQQGHGLSIFEGPRLHKIHRSVYPENLVEFFIPKEILGILALGRCHLLHLYGNGRLVGEGIDTESTSR